MVRRKSKPVKRVESTKDQLYALLRKSRPEKKRDILKHANSKLIKGLKKMAADVLHGRVPLNSQDFRRLRMHKSQLRTLALLKGSLEHKRKRLSGQIGGLPFLAALIPVLAGIVGAAKIAAPIAATVGGIGSAAAAIKRLAS